MYTQPLLERLSWTAAAQARVLRSPQLVQILQLHPDTYLSERVREKTNDLDEVIGQTAKIFLQCPIRAEPGGSDPFEDIRDVAHFADSFGYVYAKEIEVASFKLKANKRSGPGPIEVSVLLQMTARQPYAEEECQLLTDLGLLRSHTRTETTLTCNPY